MQRAYGRYFSLPQRSDAYSSSSEAVRPYTRNSKPRGIDDGTFLTIRINSLIQWVPSRTPPRCYFVGVQRGPRDFLPRKRT